jgi:thioesterase domain-containing protein
VRHLLPRRRPFTQRSLERDQFRLTETCLTDLEAYLHSNIPLSAAMGVQVKVATPERVLLFAPLGPNINHHRTVFGGSGVVLATLSAWTLLHLRLRQEQLDAQLVIQRSSMEYERPIPGDFEAVCRFSDDPAWQRFRLTLERRGRARMTLKAQLLHASHEMGSFVGDFVAMR